jgi:hypothetical protein
MTVDTSPPGDYDDNLEWLIDSLPAYLNKEEGRGNEDFLRAVANQLDGIEDSLNEVDDAQNVQNARTKEQIDRLATLVGVSKKANESVEHYRARTIARYQLNTSSGTVGDLLASFSATFSIDQDQVWYADWSKLYDMNRDVFFLPYEDVKAHPLNDSDIPDLVGRQSAAGKTVQAMYDGPLRPISETNYQSTANWTGYEITPVELNDDGSIPDGPTPGGLLDT